MVPDLLYQEISAPIFGRDNDSYGAAWRFQLSGGIVCPDCFGLYRNRVLFKREGQKIISAGYSFGC